MLRLVLICALVATSASAQPGAAGGEWRHHGGDPSFTRYSPLHQIDATNFSQLEVAWHWETADSRLVEETPRGHPGLGGSALMIGGRVYMITTRWQLAALDAGTGEELWLYDPKSYERPKARAYTSPRGIAYWTDGVAGQAGGEERILFATAGKQLVSVDLETGRPDSAFGEDGIVDMSRDFLGREQILMTNISAGSPGIVVGDTYIVGSRIFDVPLQKHNIPPGHVRAYDVRTGEQKWRFNTIPEEGEAFTETWENDSWKWMGNTNVWAPLADDEELGYVYFGTSTPSSDYWGGDRHGDNVYAESLVCVDAETGERVWHFQTVHHGIWDYDIASAPVLVDVVVDGRLRKAVAQVSKTAFAYVFDRVTGEPLWPIEERPVGQSTVPGERLAKTQPFPTKPAAFDRQGVSVDDLIDFTPELRREALEIAEQYVLGPMFAPTIVSGEGGKIATLILPSASGGSSHPGASVDPLTGILYVQSHTKVMALSVAKSDAELTEFRYVKDSQPGSRKPQGLPLVKPPWRRITAIDLKTGAHLWKAPLGRGPTDHPAIRHLDLGPLGEIVPRTPYGGHVLTKTLFITHVRNFESWDASRPNGSFLVAYDKFTGKVLGQVKTDITLNSVPITYMHEGRQFIVVPGGGGSVIGQLVAFALPASS